MLMWPIHVTSKTVGWVCLHPRDHHLGTSPWSNQPECPREDTPKPHPSACPSAPLELRARIPHSARSTLDTVVGGIRLKRTHRKPGLRFHLQAYTRLLTKHTWPWESHNLCPSSVHPTSRLSEMGFLICKIGFNLTK